MGLQQIKELYTDTRIQRFTNDDGGLIPKFNVKSAALAKLKPDKEVSPSKLIGAPKNLLVFVVVEPSIPRTGRLESWLWNNSS
jgi:hypothetical protein